jgi:CHASE2 domain-containing sensor protein
MLRTQKKKATRQSPKEPQPKPAPVQKPVRTGKLFRWRWPIILVMFFVISVLVFFASLIPLYNIVKIDDGLRNLLVYYVGTKVENNFDNRLEIMLVSEQSQQGQDGPAGQIDPSHRRYYSEMLRALSAARAKMVIFDMEFAKEAKEKEIDQEFADTIAQLKDTEVLVAADLDRGQTEPIIAPLLEPVLKNRWSIWDGGRAKGTSTVRSVRLGIENPGQQDVVGERTVTPSLALRVVIATLYPGRNVQAFFDPFRHDVVLREGGPGGIEVNRFPVDKELYFLVDMIGENEMGRHPSFTEVYSQRGNPNYMRTFQNKIVIIGYEKGDQKPTNDAAGKRFGADIQASAMSNLLQNSFIHPLSLPYHYLVIVALVVLGGLLRIKFGNLMSYTLPIRIPSFIEWKPQVPTVLIIVSLLYLFVAMLAYLTTRSLYSISYHITALFLGYLLTSAVYTKLGFR